jgi:hypothetical protein
VVDVLAGALETKVRPAVVISSSTYLVERPDVLVGILTTKAPKTTTSTDRLLMDWQLAGLRAESHFRAYVLTTHRSELTVTGLWYAHSSAGGLCRNCSQRCGARCRSTGFWNG